MAWLLELPCFLTSRWNHSGEFDAMAWCPRLLKIYVSTIVEFQESRLSPELSVHNQWTWMSDRRKRRGMSAGLFSDFCTTVILVFLRAHWISYLELWLMVTRWWLFPNLASTSLPRSFDIPFILFAATVNTAQPHVKASNPCIHMHLTLLRIRKKSLSNQLIWTSASCLCMVYKSPPQI